MSPPDRIVSRFLQKMIVWVNYWQYPILMVEKAVQTCFNPHAGLVHNEAGGSTSSVSNLLKISHFKRPLLPFLPTAFLPMQSTRNRPLSGFASGALLWRGTFRWSTNEPVRQLARRSGWGVRPGPADRWGSGARSMLYFPLPTHTWRQMLSSQPSVLHFG